MEFEYSNEVKGKVIAFRFEKWEQELIAESLKPKINLMLRRIDKINDNPKNEGQAKYRVQIEAIEREINCIKKIINAMK